MLTDMRHLIPRTLPFLCWLTVFTLPLAAQDSTRVSAKGVDGVPDQGEQMMFQQSDFSNRITFGSGVSVVR